MLTFPKRIIQTLTGSGSSADCPFDINASVSGDTVTITFPNYGTVNNVLPTSFTDSSFSLTCAATGTFYVIVRVLTNTNMVASATLTVSSTLPAPPVALLNAAPGTVDVLIGLIVNGAAIKTWGCKGINMAAIEAFRVPKASPAAFMPKYDIYYTWAIT